jgi:hypothetical protein
LFITLDAHPKQASNHSGTNPGVLQLKNTTHTDSSTIKSAINPAHPPTLFHNIVVGCDSCGLNIPIEEAYDHWKGHNSTGAVSRQSVCIRCNFQNCGLVVPLCELSNHVKAMHYRSSSTNRIVNNMPPNANSRNVSSVKSQKVPGNTTIISGNASQSSNPVIKIPPKTPRPESLNYKVNYDYIYSNLKLKRGPECVTMKFDQNIGNVWKYNYESEFVFRQNYLQIEEATVDSNAVANSSTFWKGRKKYLNNGREIVLIPKDRMSFLELVIPRFPKIETPLTSGNEDKEVDILNGGIEDQL